MPAGASRVWPMPVVTISRACPSGRGAAWAPQHCLTPAERPLVNRQQDAMTPDRFVDRSLRCADCGDEFRWTAKGQADFAAQGYPPPKRCWTCRQRRRAENETAGERIVGLFDAYDHTRQRRRR